MKPPTNVNGQPKRERFLFMGGWKSGKSYAWLSVAKMHQQRGSDATFYVIDTDRTCNEMVGYPPFETLSNVVWEEPGDWTSLMDTTKRFLDKMRTGDWLIVDMMSPCYGWIQNHICQEVYGEDLDVLMARGYTEQMQQKKLQSASKVNQGQILFDIIPWPLVKKRYDPWAVSLVSHPGHVVLVSGQKEIFNKEKGAAKEQFGGIGVKPDAQAYTGHLVNDVIWFRAPAAGEPPRLNTVGIGARGGRPVLDGSAVSNFPLQVLIKQYGWKL